MLGIYTRLSREDENSTSIQNQLREGKEFAENNGFKEYKIYNEGEGVSGTLNIEERPEFKKLLEAILANNLKAVWFRNNNRVERNSLTFHIFLDACKKTETRIFLADKEFDYNNPNELLTGSILSLLNSYTAGLQSKQTKKVLKDRVKEGKAHGVLPYGYKKDKEGFLLVDKEESEIVKKIYELSLKGKGQKSIAEYLNDRDTPTRYNTYNKGSLTTTNKYTREKTTKEKKNIQWAGKTVQGIIKNTIYKGVRIWKNEEFKAPAIVQPEYWQEVNDNLKNNSNNKSGRKVKHDYLLKGLLRCGCCGRNYYGRTRESRKDNFYMCSSKRIKDESCKQRSINRDVLENLIYTELFLHPENIEAIHNRFKEENEGGSNKVEQELSINETKLKSLKKDKEKLIDLVVENILSNDEVKGRLETNKNKSEQVEKEIKDLKDQLKKEKTAEKEIKDFNTLMTGIGTTLSYNQIKDLTHSLVKNIILNHEKEKDNWIINIEFKTGKQFRTEIDRETYKNWLTLKPLKERFKVKKKKNTSGSNNSDSNDNSNLEGWCTNTTNKDVALVDVNTEIKRLFT